jgi:hypothetical protein
MGQAPQLEISKSQLLQVLYKFAMLALCVALLWGFLSYLVDGCEQQ